ncbi:MAG: hypothetical protein JWP61_1994, partial [Friedmanniella sp.]|nr:hypothetical protein [Friedmanniella sp.]
SIDRLPKYPENPDPYYSLAKGNPNDPGSVAYSTWQFSQIREWGRPGGEFEVRLGQQWIVSFYAQWDEIFRPRLAAVRGVPVPEIKVPLLGDLRRLRHDIVHNKGVASPQWTGKCAVLTKWFSAEERIVLRGSHYANFYLAVPWTTLRGQ